MLNLKGFKITRGINKERKEEKRGRRGKGGSGTSVIIGKLHEIGTKGYKALSIDQIWKITSLSLITWIDQKLKSHRPA